MIGAKVFVSLMTFNLRPLARLSTRLIFLPMRDTDKARRIIPVMAKITDDESRAFEALKVKLGSRGMPWTDSNTLRHAMKVACQAEKIDWPAVDS